MTLAESSILVVDDEPVLRLTFSVLLQRMGARVFAAEDGVEALRIATENHVDVILTDKQMPNMDGLALLQQLRERDVTAPAVLFVNGVVPEDSKLLERLGVKRSVTKPIHPQELILMLEAVLASVAAVPHERDS